MILKVRDKFLVAEISLGFDDSLKFEVEFPIFKIEELINGKRKELFVTSESEEEASSVQDWQEWREDL